MPTTRERGGGRCIAADVGTLVSIGLVDGAAQGEVDAAPLCSQLHGAGLIRIAFAEPGTSRSAP